MGKVEFTKEMKQDYTILFPDMTNIHFKLLKNIFISYGYHVEVLYNQGQAVVDEGLKYVHNDTCYPALLCIGQYMDALKSGKYDVHKTALMMFQTGGGCRASNYIHLIRKALDKAGFGFVPVISLNFRGLEENSGFKITFSMLRKGMASLAYGDLLMLLRNQVMPYEVDKGSANALVDQWIETLSALFMQGHGFKSNELKAKFNEIARSFAKIKIFREPKIKVGIVGEIYIKYAALGNNNLEKFLYEQGCETMVPGLLDFLIYGIQDGIEDHKLYGGNQAKYIGLLAAKKYLVGVRRNILLTADRHGFTAPSDFEKLIQNTDGIIGRGCKMGEGWLLTAEMLELTELGYGNIVCVQPFGCLPNHIVGKGMIRKIKAHCPDANIVPIDYDPGATHVNQENRIKLMLSIAAERMNPVQIPVAASAKEAVPEEEKVPEPV